MERPVTLDGLSKRFALYLVVSLALLALAAVACGVKSGDRAPARPGGELVEFHRSPVKKFNQLRIDLTKTEAGCTADPADVTVQFGQRVRLAIQLPTEIQQGTTRSLEVVGEVFEVTYVISGLEISASGGALGTGITAISLVLSSGSRASYDFNPATVGSFDILCDGVKAGVFTVNPA